MEIPNLFIVLAIMFLAMLPFYQLIGKRILYNKNRKRKTQTHQGLHLGLHSSLSEKRYLKKGLYSPKEDIFAIDTNNLPMAQALVLLAIQYIAYIRNTKSQK